MGAERTLVVVDSGPVIALAGADCLDLLRSLYDRIVMPTVVRDEIAAPPTGRPGAAAVLGADWIEHLPPLGLPDPFIAGALDYGEAAVIALARTLPGAEVLIDERRGRRVAKTAYGLAVVGTVGVLLRGKQSGLLQEIDPAIRRILQNGYYLSERLVSEALRIAGER